VFDFYVIVDGKLIGFDSASKADDFFNEVELSSETTVEFVKVYGVRCGDCV